MGRRPRSRNASEAESVVAAPLRAPWNPRSLLINRFWLGLGKEFLKSGIIADWVPDGIDLQTRNGNVFSRWDREQLAKYFCSLLGLASVPFDLGWCGKKRPANKRILFYWQRLCCFSRNAKRIGVTPQTNVDP